MKIAVSSTGRELSSPIDPRFGRALFFIIYNTDDDTFEVIDNQQNVQAAHGAGIQAAQAVVNSEATMVVAGNYGPKASQVLTTAHITSIMWAEGTVADAIDKVKNNQLPAEAKE
jgi:predicted Fe-Mo cluster-binding NifX family protein